MTLAQKMKQAAGMVAALAVIGLTGVLLNSGRVQADNDKKTDDSESSKIQQGFDIAPVKLNLTGKNRAMVGLGSYIVNAQADCNGCHSAGNDTEFLAGGNPYFGQKPTKVNPDTYLGGGNDFGPFPGPGPFPHIISRNLTPDKTGLPEGGTSFADFVKIIRTGVDPDHLHPTCGAGGPNGKCLPAPFDGSLLQIMPWPIYHNMTDRDLEAIYTYLSAIPCIAGPPAPDPRHHNCK